ncbi:Hypothetical protein D9617_12g035400 [Elsinoe fawcettii]|nr:Hypothetical protein D9617_12g035400 [Elsinoe fawcettii]
MDASVPAWSDNTTRMADEPLMTMDEIERILEFSLRDTTTNPGSQEPPLRANDAQPGSQVAQPKNDYQNDGMWRHLPDFNPGSSLNLPTNDYQLDTPLISQENLQPGSTPLQTDPNYQVQDTPLADLDAQSGSQDHPIDVDNYQTQIQDLGTNSQAGSYPQANDNDYQAWNANFESGGPFPGSQASQFPPNYQVTDPRQWVAQSQLGSQAFQMPLDYQTSTSNLWGFQQSGSQSAQMPLNYQADAMYGMAEPLAPGSTTWPMTGPNQMNLQYPWNTNALLGSYPAPAPAPVFCPGQTANQSAPIRRALPRTGRSVENLRDDCFQKHLRQPRTMATGPVILANGHLNPRASSLANEGSALKRQRAPKGQRGATKRRKRSTEQQPPTTASSPMVGMSHPQQALPVMAHQQELPLAPGVSGVVGMSHHQQGLPAMDRQQ